MLNLKIPSVYDQFSVQKFLDVFHLSKKKIRQLESLGNLFVNGKIEPFTYLLKQGDYIQIDDFFEEEIDYPINDQPLNVVYEDEWILAVEKPADMICYDVEKRNTLTLANLVAGHYNKTSQDLKIRHLHRIDKDTTGLVLYAKNFLSHAYFSTLWDTSTVERKYLAIVEGKLAKSIGSINLPIGSDRHQNNHYVVSLTGKKAVTNYKVLKEMNDSSLIECSLETGRTHQIRVHFGYLGHPLVGDIPYGSKMKASRSYLHSYQIHLFHPYLNQYITITQNIPSDMLKHLSERGIYEY